MLPAAIEAMTLEMARLGNPSSLHGPGRDARRRVEECREQLAEALGARPSEVVFTSGGTESDNLGVIGMFRRRRALDTRRTRLVVAAAEHSAVIDAATALHEREGAQITWVEPDRDGLIDPEAVRAALTDGPVGADDVALLACMWVNNEVGTVQPVAELAALAGEYDVPMFSDAVQAVGKVPVDFGASGLTAAAMTGHKLGGPTGLGVLLARRDAPIEQLTHGGGQERGVRSGTLATALVAGLTAATLEATAALPTEQPRLAALRDHLVEGALAAVPGARVTGYWKPGDVLRRSPANAHLLLPDCAGDSLLFLLDAAGIACSTGSACHAGVPQPSHVVLAMGYTEEEARGALRLSLGHTSTRSDVEAFLAVLPAAVERAQRAHRAAKAS